MRKLKSAHLITSFGFGTYLLASCAQNNNPPTLVVNSTSEPNAAILPQTPTPSATVNSAPVTAPTNAAPLQSQGGQKPAAPSAPSGTNGKSPNNAKASSASPDSKDATDEPALAALKKMDGLELVTQLSKTGVFKTGSITQNNYLFKSGLFWLEVAIFKTNDHRTYIDSRLYTQNIDDDLEKVAAYYLRTNHKTQISRQEMAGLEYAVEAAITLARFKSQFKDGKETSPPIVGLPYTGFGSLSSEQHEAVVGIADLLPKVDATVRTALRLPPLSEYRPSPKPEIPLPKHARPHQGAAGVNIA